MAAMLSKETVLGNEQKHSKGPYLRLPSHASKCDAEEDDDSNRPNDPHVIDIIHHLSPIVLKIEKMTGSEI